MLAVTHVNDVLDIYSGIDTGTNTTFGPLGDNNGAIGGIGGFNLTLMGGNLTILALTHIGPEDATRALSPLGVNANGQWRFYNDVLVTWKATDALTLVTEANLVRDDYGPFGQGAERLRHRAICVVHADRHRHPERPRRSTGATTTTSSSLRSRATTGPILLQQGFAVPYLHVAPGSNTTYGALTLGVTWKPALPAPITGLLVRPEIRWDHAFTNNHPFNAQTDNNAFTIGMDAVLTF